VFLLNSRCSQFVPIALLLQKQLLLLPKLQSLFAEFLKHS